MFLAKKSLKIPFYSTLAFTLIFSSGNLIYSQEQKPKPAYPLTADSLPQEHVQKGTLIHGKYTSKDGSVFPGTEREYSVYLPHGFDPNHAYPYMVFQDGVIYQAPVVFDNLIAKKEIPPLIGIFIKPGITPPPHENALPRFNRSFEYDSVSARYSSFVLEEFIPAIQSRHQFKLSSDPNQAGIAGSSSGGIAAFVAAWHRPDAFRRVYTGVGTYVGLRGGDQLSTLVRKTEPKPIRFFLQDGSNDLNIYCGDWWMANQTMERALTWAGYAVDHRWSEGGHDHLHASQVMPEAMKWIWKDWERETSLSVTSDHPSQWKGLEIVDLDSEWMEVEGPDLSPEVQTLNVDTEGKVSTTNQLNPRLSRFQKDHAIRMDSLPKMLEGASAVLSPDQTLIYLAPKESAYLHSAQLDDQGNLRYLQPYYMIHALDDGIVGDRFETGGLSVDREGRLYVSTNLGLQVCDQAGRVNYILRTPGTVLDVCFGGEDFSHLYILTMRNQKKKVYYRKTKTQGIHSHLHDPMVPEKPRL